MKEIIKSEAKKYSEIFRNRWSVQRHLWVDVQHFQRYWDIDAPDFRDMFMKATESASYYLHSSGYTPRAFIIKLTSYKPDEVREMFRALYDESEPIDKRCRGFIEETQRLKRGILDNVDYQNMPAISTYLWLRYPEKYCIFKQKLYKEVARRVGEKELSSRENEISRVVDFWSIFRNFAEILSSDGVFRNELDSKLDGECYRDEKCAIAALDLCFWIHPMWAGRKNSQGILNPASNTNSDTEEEIPVTKTNESFFSKNMILYGPPGTGKTYNSVIYAVAICDGKTIEEVQEYDYGIVLKRFEELKNSGRIAFTTFHQSYGYEEFIEGIKPVTDEETGNISYEVKNGIFKEFCNKAELPKNAEINHNAQVYIVRLKGNGDNDLKRECFRDGEIRFDWPSDYTDGWMKWFGAMKPGDYVLSYYGQSRNIDGIGVVCDEEAIFDESKSSYKWTRKVKWLVTDKIMDILDANGGKYLSNFHVGRVPDMKLSSLLKLIGGNTVDTSVEFDKAWQSLVAEAVDHGNKYTFTRRSDFTLEAAYTGDDRFRIQWSGGTYNDLKKTDIYDQWKNTEITAESIPNGGNRWLFTARQAVIDELGKYGLRGCDETSIDKKSSCVFIIDEINRGNISKIFGELITLIEETKRKGESEEMSAVLPYSNTEFSVPQNVYIIGTMNTADRSIALMDTALRRRFSFVEMMPSTDVLKKMGVEVIKDGNTELNVAKMLDVINRRIECLYDREHCIGHAFFAKLKGKPYIETLALIFEKSVIPLLQEYFYEDYAKIQYVLGDNQKEDALKFILDKAVDARDIFSGIPDIDLPEKSYSIQDKAFNNIYSYKAIGADL